jgi:hypothetical protein
MNRLIESVIEGTEPENFASFYGAYSDNPLELFINELQALGFTLAKTSKHYSEYIYNYNNRSSKLTKIYIS